MKKIKLGELEVSNVCLGAMTFGTTTDKESAFRVLDAFVDAGGTFIDTSNNYAHWAGTGDESETVLGEWFASSGKRKNVVLATKVGYDRHGQGAGLKRSQILYWVDESLRKLKTDYIDLYYAHVDDPNTPLEETMEAFDSLVKAGKVRKLGGSNYDTWRFAEARTIAETKGYTLYTVLQQRFSYLHVKGDAAPGLPFNEYVSRERLRYLAKYNVPLVAYSSLAKGGYSDHSRLSSDFIIGERLEKLDSYAAEMGIAPSTLAVAWMCSLYRMPGYPTVVPLFGASSVEHLKENIAGADIELSDEVMKALKWY